MFDKLLKLIKSNSSKTPLEDFTTELLVEILNNLPKLKKKFCQEFLGLKSDYFIITSQVRYDNSVIDIEIKGEGEICFIENKVNSKEGFGFDENSLEEVSQLEKYCKILDKFANDDFQTKLLYCTKKDEPKVITKHSFYQFKWHHIAHFLEPYKEEKLIELFINFLKAHDMAHDMKLTSKDILAIENFGRVFQIMNKHMERVKGDFEKLFPNVKDLRRGKPFEHQLEIHNRFCVYSESPVEGEGWTEILYAFELSGVITTHIFIHIENQNYSNFRKELDNEYKNTPEYLIEHSDVGSKIYMEKKLGSYINDEKSEVEIENWFKDSFVKMDEFRQKTKNTITWKKTEPK